MKRKVPLALTFLLLALAIASCIFVFFLGENKLFYRKASTVCLECIGIG